jgi:hypothetical protein
MRRRKKKRKIKQSLEFGVRSSEFKFIADCLFPIMDWIAQRTIIKRIPSSITERAQSSIEPKIMGVKISKKMRISLIKKISIVIGLLSY